MSNPNTTQNDMLKHYSMVTKLVHYTSKFTVNDDGKNLTQQPIRTHRLSSTLDLTDKQNDGPRFRLAPIWPEWNEAEINAESWDMGMVKKKETTSIKNRADTKTINIPTISHIFEDPEGKIELPPSLKLEQWKRPIDFLPSDKSPVIVDPELGIQNFDLITSNEHLHCSEIMRNIISQITILWDICRKERKNLNIISDNIIQRTWRPWEHIYALNKVSKPPFMTPYNPSGKYIVRLFFLGSWRKIIIDDSIPFDSNNRCLLPQTTLSYELWPMLLSKALLKVISLDFYSSDDLSEYSESSVIHLLTGWIPEPIPLKYTHAEQIWNFLRYGRAEKSEADDDAELQLTSASSGPVQLFKWPERKSDQPEEITLFTVNSKNNLSPKDQTDKSDDKSSKKGEISSNLTIPKELTVIKSANIKENRTVASANVIPVKDVKKPTGTALRTGVTDDFGSISDDPMSPEAPKLIIFATMSHLQPARISSYSETADRSERLRRYNLNETYSSPVLLTTIRDIPLEPPPTPVSPEFIPAWKLIRPRKPKLLPHAEPIIPTVTKSERWIEISSPYINYPRASALNIKPTTRPRSNDRNIPIISRSTRANRLAKRLSIPNAFNMIDEDENMEYEKMKLQCDSELMRSTTSLSLPTTKKELNVIDTLGKSDDSGRSAGSKAKRKMSMAPTKILRKSTGTSIKVPSDALSVKSKGGESDRAVTPIDVPTIGNNNEQQISPTTNKKCEQTPKIWMDFDDFAVCFTSIIVFHNPRAYQYTHKHTDIKFTPYQPPIVSPVTKEKKKESNQPIIQAIPALQDDKSSLYLFVDSTRETLEKPIELVISFTCLPRWYDAFSHEPIVVNEKATRGLNLSTEKLSADHNLTKTIISQKEIIPQPGSLLAEIHSWKSLSIGQPILRLHTTATKAALLTLAPGRHVLKFSNTCPFGFNLQVLSNSNDFMIGDEDQLLNKLISVPEDAEFIIQAEELFYALDDSVETFHLITPKENKLHSLLNFYCQHAPQSINLDIQTCLNIFNQALYSTIRTILNPASSIITPEIQFAWRCFANDLSTADILGVYETKRPTTTSASRHSARAGGPSSAHPGGGSLSKKGGGGGGKDKTSDEKSHLKHQPSLITDFEDSSSDLLTRELNLDEIASIINIQKIIRGFLQRRINLARKIDTEKNRHTQQILQSTMSLLKNDYRSTLILFKNFLLIKPELIQCFSFRNDDWNMVHYHDYHGIYQEQTINTWFILFREIFYITEENFLVAKFLSHLSNSVLRVINNDTYEEIPLVFNRLMPRIFTKNKNGYTFIAEGMTYDQSVLNGRFRLRLITSYTSFPEIHADQLTSSFLTKEIRDYYIPNKEDIICRYRVVVTDDYNQTGRNYHLASIRFSTSKSDVFVRLSILDDNQEIVSVEGKGTVVLPAVLFMRPITNSCPRQSSASLSRQTSKSAGSRKKESHTHSTNIEDTKGRNGRQSRSNSQVGLTTAADGDDKIHKYIIQVKLLYKSWPLTFTQWQFIEQVKQHEQNELKIVHRQPSPTKIERPNSTSTSGKRTSHASPNRSSTGGKGRTGSIKSTTPTSSRPHTAKNNADKPMIDPSKPHWILQIVSDADKSDELYIKKDTERYDELQNIKKAWETLENGRAKKAMQTRQKFLESLHIKIDDQPSPDINDEITNISETPTDSETSTTKSISEQQQQPEVVKPRKKSPSSTKKGAIKEENPKQVEIRLSPLPTDEPLLNELPASLTKPKLSLPPLDIKPFIKRKLPSNEFVTADSLYEQENFDDRQHKFNEYFKYLNKIRQDREEDQQYRSKEKIHQLEEYINLQGNIDQIRRKINQPREAYRQRLLQIERQRLEELAIQQQKLIDEQNAKAAAEAAAMIKPVKKKTTVGKKTKK